jgi:hypothetical protein
MSDVKNLLSCFMLLQAAQEVQFPEKSSNDKYLLLNRRKSLELEMDHLPRHDDPRHQHGIQESPHINMAGLTEEIR